jgi:hypothetical protein
MAVALAALVTLVVGAIGCEGLHSQTMHPGSQDAAGPDAAEVIDAGADGTLDLAIDTPADAASEAHAADVAVLEDGAFTTSLDLAIAPDADPIGDPDAPGASVDQAEPDPDPDPMAMPLMIVIGPAAAVRMVDESVAFTASLVASDGTARDVGDLVVWASSRPQVATIDADGVAIAVSIGVTEISARLGSLVGVETFTVAAPKIQAVFVAPAAATIVAGAIQAFKATVLFTTGEIFDVTEAVVWKSSRTEIASLSLVPGSVGVAVGKAPGQTEISCELLGFSARAVLTVTPRAAAARTVSPARGL